MKNKIVLATLVSSALHFTANAGELNMPNSFTAGTPAVAASVNANFAAVETAVDGNATDITTLLASVTAMEARLSAIESDNANLVADNNMLQNFIADVLPYLEGGTDSQGNPTVFFSGVNVHVNNGEDFTEIVDGTGNLIVGYDESVNFETIKSFCTAFDPQTGNAYDAQTECENDNGVWGNQLQKIGSHNLVIGSGHTYTQFGGLIAGRGNTVTAPNSTVSGGAQNFTQGFNSSVTGGFFNDASGSFSSVSGGSDNDANGVSSSVSGGFANIASKVNSSVSGGHNNQANGGNSSISGGQSVLVSGSNDWAAGTLFEDQ